MYSRVISALHCGYYTAVGWARAGDAQRRVQRRRLGWRGAKAVPWARAGVRAEEADRGAVAAGVEEARGGGDAMIGSTS